MLRILWVLTLVAGCTSQKPAPKEWQDWVKGLQDRYVEKFSTPSIVHHVYLNQIGDVYFIKEEVQGLRWSKSCENCKYKVLLKEGLKVALYVDDQEAKVLEPKVQTSVDNEGRIYLTAYEQKSENKIRVFIHDMKLKNLAKKRKRQFFDYDPQSILETEFEWLKSPEKMTMNRSDGSTKIMNIVARLNYMIEGKKGHFSIYDYGQKEDDYKEEQKIMLLYRDFSNGKKTYGAGRFLVVDLNKKLKEMTDKDKVEIDLNYSYNPPCAVSTGFHCPLPQDLLSQNATVGEQFNKVK